MHTVSERYARAMESVGTCQRITGMSINGLNRLFARIQDNSCGAQEIERRYVGIPRGPEILEHVRSEMTLLSSNEGRTDNSVTSRSPP